MGNHNQYKIKKADLYYRHYSCSRPLIGVFLQEVFRLSNSFRSSVVNSLLLRFFKSGCPAFIQAVYQKEATAKIDCRILLSIIPFSFAVVKKPEAEVTAGALITWARERIAGYKLPKSVDFVDALPRNPTGKILKRELRKPYWGDKQRQVH